MILVMIDELSTTNAFLFWKDNFMLTIVIQSKLKVIYYFNFDCYNYVKFASGRRVTF